jgi:hypothetical protein
MRNQEQEFNELLKHINRLEVIDHTGEKLGRIVVIYGAKVEVSFQDGFKTMKVFLSDYKDNDCKCDKCGSESRGSHSCPYDEEFNNGYSDSCNCCDSCRYECLMDI